jgi:CheY-like chemotaxis protein
MNSIRLLLVDDSRADRALFVALLAGDPDHPWLRDVDIVAVDKPLDQVEQYAEYDGVLLDLSLGGGLTGLDIARQIHQFDWRIPTMVITGMHDDAIPVDALNYTDAVVPKQSARQRQTGDVFGVTRVFLRNIARARRGPTTTSQALAARR